MSRNLRLARIDDRAKTLVPPEEYSPTFGDGVFMSPLDLITYPVGDDLGLAVCGLTSAELFWADFRSDRLPDLVVGDIDFEMDKSTPLQSWSGLAQHIPTGLSHIKPLAALARAVGRPLAVAMHSANTKQWKDFLEHKDGKRPDTKVFGLLAAHEAIELAAILGDPIPWTGVNDLDPVWHWLHTRSDSNPRAALAVALRDYRRQVVERVRRSAAGNDPLALRVPYGAAEELRAWCQRMSGQSGPLGAAGADIGLPLLYADGRIDRINFASLFADIEGILDAALPSACFDLTTPVPDDPIWELADGLPRIGALVASLGGLDEATTAARRALAQLPPIPGSQVRRNLREIEPNTLARGLAVLFAAVEVYHTDEAFWNGIWSEGPWDPVRLCDQTILRDTSPPADRRGAPQRHASLEDWVDRTEQAVRLAASEEEDDEGAFVDLGVITTTLVGTYRSETGLDLTGRLGLQAVAVHLEFLRQMELVEIQTDPAGDSMYRIRQPSGHGLRPVRPAKGVTGLMWDSDSLPTVLRDRLGFGEDADQAVGQMLYAAFLSDPGVRAPAAHTQGKLGRDDILNPFVQGEAPGWLVAVCRAYARDKLGWTDERTWPACLRGR